LTENELAKLKSTASQLRDTLKYLHPDRAVPCVENFGNEFDVVARLACWRPEHRMATLRLTRAALYRPRAWGHFLNAHYLADIGTRAKSALSTRRQGRCCAV